MTEPAAYRVLARTYRPSSFADLIGQEVLVRTLSNAIAQNRIAHAFVLTGIRGIGKTTTARIIARALNCETGPTITPCGTCANCMALTTDRHVDVIEMDAATNTGVDHVRDLIEAVQYAPAMARYKIFIIDEVHMLSKSAFNALLKTLEEPPPYIKFIFATTELRKIPVTILSRCQRFDLKRLDTETLAAHLANICAKEGVQAEAEALTLIAAAGDGSVRDALSLLDQAIAHHGGTTQPIAAQQVRDMLGLADRAQIFALIERLSEGDATGALAIYRNLYQAGADIPTLLEDIAEATHFITQVKLDPALAEDVAFAQSDRESAKALAENLSIPALSRLWQMTIKGLQEAQIAPDPSAAVQMVLVRLAYAGTLPTPGEVLQQLQVGDVVPMARPTGAPITESRPAPRPAAAAPMRSQSSAAVQMVPEPAPVAPSMALPDGEPIAQFASLVESLNKREPLLYHYLTHETKLVSIEEGKLELEFTPSVPKDIAGQLGRTLTEMRGSRWIVILSQGSPHPTLNQRAQSQREAAKAEALETPLVQQVLASFPGAKLHDVTPTGD